VRGEHRRPCTSDCGCAFSQGRAAGRGDLVPRSEPAVVEDEAMEVGVEAGADQEAAVGEAEEDAGTTRQ
jgi:hypothetical protein